jgi:radical SAM superfamily enzyme YgiQ (UPF0313 family)
MPHLVLVALSGFRVREERLRELGMTLPGFHQRAGAIGQLPALGLLTLAGLLPEDWTCEYHSPALVTDELVEQIAASRPTLVAISALTASILEAYSLSAALRARGFRVVLGGLHVTACPDEAEQHADAVVIGSAEAIWPAVLQDVSAGELRPRYAASKHRAVPWSLPRWDLLTQPVARYTLQTQRGCPWACDFCGASRLLGSFQEKPLPLVERELQAITRRTGRPLLELADDNTFAGERDATALLDLLGQSGAKWFTEADWRIGERSELLNKLAASGCRQVLVGIESMIFRYPGMGKKQAELARIMDAVSAIQAAGVAVNGCFIVGAEGETHASLARLTDFLLAAPFAEIQLTLQTPFPGTGLYAKLQEQGRLLAERTWSHYTLFDVTYLPDLLSVAELENGFQEVLRHVFAPAATSRRDGIRKQIWSRRHAANRPRTDTGSDRVIPGSTIQRKN